MGRGGALLLEPMRQYLHELDAEQADVRVTTSERDDRRAQSLGPRPSGLEPPPHSMSRRGSDGSRPLLGAAVEARLLCGSLPGLARSG